MSQPDPAPGRLAAVFRVGLVACVVVLLLGGFVVLIGVVGFLRLNADRDTPPTGQSPVAAATDLARPNAASVANDVPVPEPAVGSVERAPAALPNSATLIRVDDTSAGGWVGRYGMKGYSVAMAGHEPQLPPGCKVRLFKGRLFTWDALTTDPRALSIPETPSKRSAGQWFCWDDFTIDLDLTEAGEPYQLGLYLMDWDSDDRVQRLRITDRDSGAVLLDRTDAHFRKGKYLLLRVSGHLLLQITRTGGPNCTLSGIFFDAPPRD